MSNIEKHLVCHKRTDLIEFRRSEDFSGTFLSKINTQFVKNFKSLQGKILYKKVLSEYTHISLLG
jgi:hypothetical protein